MTSCEPYMLNMKGLLFQSWMYVWMISVPHLLHYFISFCAQSKALDSFPKLNENHVPSILQLPNKFNSLVRVLMVRTVSLWNDSTFISKKSNVCFFSNYWFTTRFFEMHTSRLQSEMYVLCKCTNYVWYVNNIFKYYFTLLLDSWTWSVCHCTWEIADL